LFWVPPRSGKLTQSLIDNDCCSVVCCHDGVGWQAAALKVFIDDIKNHTDDEGKYVYMVADFHPELNAMLLVLLHWLFEVGS
jgi:hypothetical protein